jgi:hypothetical protein
VGAESDIAGEQRGDSPGRDLVEVLYDGRGPVGRDEALCPYEAHRSTDWRGRAQGLHGGTVAGKWQCGICHPPARSIPPERIERRSPPGEGR